MLCCVNDIKLYKEKTDTNREWDKWTFIIARTSYIWWWWCPFSVSVDACSSVQCQNGGTCSVNILGQAVCACPTGFGGQLCESMYLYNKYYTN